MKRSRLFWDDCSPARRAHHWAASIRGWLFALTDKHEWPNMQRDGIGWTEPSSLGSYLDYGPDHYRSRHEYCTQPVGQCECRLSQPGNIHCVVYTEGAGVRPHRYVDTVEQAHAWIEEQVRAIRPELFREKAA